MITFAVAAASIRDLKETHKGETAWILGSGSSLDYVPPDFFRDKLTIGVNATHYDFPLTFAFAHHREDAQAAIDRGFMVVASEYDRCDEADGLNNLRGFHYQYKHPQQPSSLVMDMTPFERNDDDALVVGSNTVTSAMDFAGRILGASAVLLCGVDGGMIDGRINYRGYNGGGPDIESIEKQTTGGTGLPHIRAQAPLIETVANSLRSRGVFVGSLIPFVNVGFEGHVYTQ